MCIITDEYDNVKYVGEEVASGRVILSILTPPQRESEPGQSSLDHHIYVSNRHRAATLKHLSSLLLLQYIVVLHSLLHIA